MIKTIMLQPADNKQFFLKFSSILLIVSFIFLALFSANFILEHADHEHDQHGAGGSCTVCTKIQTIQNLNLLKLFVPVRGILSILFGLVLTSYIPKIIFYNLTRSTPLLLKVRLNN